MADIIRPNTPPPAGVSLSAKSPAPAAPTSSPAPSKPSSDAPPPAAPTPAKEDGPDNPFAELDAKFLAAGSDLAPKKVAAPAEAAKPKPEEPAPAAQKVEPSRTPKELRAELDRVKSEFEANKKSTAALEAKIKEYETKGKDTASLVALLEAKEKREQDLLAENRALKHEASPEFKAKYDKGFDEAADWAKDYVNRLTKQDGTKADFLADFVPLYRLAKDTTVGNARAKAVEIFGENEAAEVVDSVKELVRLDRIREKAFEEEKIGWEAKQKEAEGVRVQRQFNQSKQERELFDKVNEDLRNSVENYRDPVDDNELSSLRQQGYKIFDTIINTKPKNLEEKLVHGAHLKQRCAAYGPNQLTIKRQAEKIASLEKQLADLTPTRPGGANAKPTGGETQSEPEDWAGGLRKAVKG